MRVRMVSTEVGLERTQLLANKGNNNPIAKHHQSPPIAKQQSQNKRCWFFLLTTRISSNRDKQKAAVSSSSTTAPGCITTSLRQPNSGACGSAQNTDQRRTEERATLVYEGDHKQGIETLDAIALRALLCGMCVCCLDLKHCPIEPAVRRQHTSYHINPGEI